MFNFSFLQKSATLLLLSGVFILLAEVILLVPSQVDESEVVGRTELIDGKMPLPIYDEPDQTAEPAEADQVLTGFRYTASERQKKKWSLDAHKARLFQSSQLVDAEDVNIAIYNDAYTQPFMIQASGAKFHLEDKNLELSGNVQIVSPDDYQFKSEKIFYDFESEFFRSPIETQISGPLNQVNPLRVTGDQFFSYLSDQKASFEGDVHAYKKFGANEKHDRFKVDIKSDKMDVFREDRYIDIHGDVTMDRTSSVSRASVKSQRARFDYDPSLRRPKRQTGILKYLVFNDDVRFSERLSLEGQEPLLRTARCGQAEFFGPAGLVRLSENPVLKQGTDRLEGKEISFYLGKDLVEIDAAKAEFRIEDSQWERQ